MYGCTLCMDFILNYYYIEYHLSIFKLNFSKKRNLLFNTNYEIVFPIIKDTNASRFNRSIPDCNSLNLHVIA